MSMRGTWIVPVVSCLAMTLLPTFLRAEGDGADAAARPTRRPASPAEIAAAEAQLAAQAAGQGYGQASFIPAYAPPAMMGVHPAAYFSPQAGPVPGGMGAAPPPGMFPGAYGAPGAPPMYAQGPTPDVYGSYGAMPVDYGAIYGGQPMPMGGQQMGGPQMGGPQMQMSGGPCPYCGGQGCDACDAGGHGRGLHHGLLGDVIGVIGPYPDGGCAAIRWLDFSIDFMMLRRDDAGRNVDFASLGVGNANIVLSSSDIDFDDEPSFRFTGAFQIGPGSNLEFTYYGLFEHSDIARVEDPNALLFSVLSDFGTNPIFGFPETDFANIQQIDYRSTFDSFEANFRQRWMAPNCRYQGSWLIGARHFILDEELVYFTNVPDTDINGDPINNKLTDITTTTNSMTGIQFGGDVWICLLPGLRLGAEAKGGVYGNHITASTAITTNTGLNPFFENLSTNDVSFVGDANVQALYRINYQWTLRVGYNALFVEGVALAPENFNTIPPFGPQQPNRLPFINDDGNVFYHGWNAGLEFMW